MAKAKSYIVGGVKYLENEAGKIVNAATGVEQSEKYSDTIRELHAEEKVQEQEKQADEQEVKATKRQEDTTKPPLPDNSGEGKSGWFGRAAKSVTDKVFATMFPRLAGLMKELDTDINENNKVGQSLDTNMQAVTQQLNETNNLLSQLNSQMTKMLGLLGQVLSRGGTAAGSARAGGGMAAAFIGGLLGVAAAAAVPYITKWLSGDNKPNDVTPPPDLTPEVEVPPPPAPIPLPPVPERRADAVSTSNIQQVAFTSDDTRQRQMAATGEFEKGSAGIISTYSNMSESQQASAGGLDTILNTYKSDVGKKYGVNSFAMRMSDYTTQEGQLKPAFEAGDNGARPQNTVSAALEELKTTSESANRDLKIDAEKISFNADGIMFNQSGGDETDQQGYGSSSGGSMTPGSGGGGFGGFFPVPKPELATVTSKGGASAQVAVKYKERFQGLVDYLDNTNPGYIKVLGGYNNRPNVNNPSVPSWHAYGAALDINPSENPNGSTKTTLPPGIGDIAKSYGLGWGMNWNSVKDPMHFSAAPNEGGTGDIFIPGPAAGGSGTETQAQQAPNFVRPTIMQGSNLAKAAAPSGGGTTPSSAPGQTTSPVKSSPATPSSQQTGAPDKLKNSNIAGLVEPPDAATMYPIWFGAAMSAKYSHRHDEVR